MPLKSWFSSRNPLVLVQKVCHFPRVRARFGTDFGGRTRICVALFSAVGNIWVIALKLGVPQTYSVLIFFLSTKFDSVFTNFTV